MLVYTSTTDKYILFIYYILVHKLVVLHYLTSGHHNLYLQRCLDCAGGGSGAK